MEKTNQNQKLNKAKTELEGTLDRLENKVNNCAEKKNDDLDKTKQLERDLREKEAALNIKVEEVSMMTEDLGEKD